MRLTKNGVVKLRDRLIERGLVLKDKKGRLKTSVMYNSVYLVSPKSYNSVQNRTTEYNGAVQLSGTKNNNKNNKDNKGQFSNNKERIKQALKSGKLSLLRDIS